MRGFCTRFQKSILLIMEILLYVVNYIVFFALLGINNKQLLVLSRTSVVITFSWIIVTLLLTIIYGKYDVGVRKSRPIITSLTLTAIMRDIVAYLLLMIMNRNEDNNQTFKIEFVGIFLAIILFHVLWIFVMTYAGNGFYFYVKSPQDTLVVCSDMSCRKRLTRVIGRFHRQYKIVDFVTYNDDGLKEKMNKAQCVFMYDVPIAERTMLVNECYRSRKNFYFNPEISDILAQSARQAMFDDMSFLACEERRMSFEQRVIKRLTDIIISVVALVLASPIFIVAAILIKKYDGGPVFFRQERATLNGKVFLIYKFRTMKVDSGNRSVTKDDDRITPIGKVLRKYRIDELPQFINILKGEMSVVGPRPEMMENVNAYTKELPEFFYRLRMKAGLTGYAQIVGKYNTTSRDKLMLDLLYIENFSVFKDIQLIFQTALVLLKADDSTEAFEED